MTPNRTTHGDFVVFRLSLNSVDVVELNAPTNDDWNANPTSVNLMLEGSCSLFIRGASLHDGLVIPHSRNEFVPTLKGFDLCRQNRVNVSKVDVTLTVEEPSVYLCVTRRDGIKLPLSYSVVDTDQAVIPAGALFIPTENCSSGSESFIKSEPYLNASAPKTLTATTGKVVVVQKKV